MIRLIPHFKHKNYYRLSNRILFSVIICSSILTLIASAIQLYFDYQKYLDQIYANFRFIEKSYLPSINASVYKIDREQMKTLADGLLKIEEIVFLEVIDGETIFISAGETTAKKDISQIYNLEFKNYSGKLIPIGKLIVYASLAGVKQRLIEKAIVILVTNLGKTLIASVVFLIIIQYLSTRHLKTMADYADQINLRVLDDPLILNRKTSKIEKFDELDRVTLSINNMRLRLKQDIADQKQTENALKESELRFRNTFEQATMGIVHVDLSGKFTQVNDRFCYIVKYTKTEILERAFHDITHPDDLTDDSELLNKAINDKLSSFSLEKRFIRKDNSIVWVNLHVKLLKFESGKPDYFIAIIEDISLRKKSEQKLKHYQDNLSELVKERTIELENEIQVRKYVEVEMLKAKEIAEQANQFKSEYLSNISHEIRTPMHQILSFSKFGADKIDTAKKEKLLYYFVKIGTIGRSLLHILNDLLDLSKLESGKMKYDIRKNDLRQIIDQVMQEFVSLVSEKGIVMEMTDLCFQAKVLCDSHKISQVIRNLLSNAFKFTPKNKKIKISIMIGELSRHADQPNNHRLPALIVKIADQGAGIPKSEINSVFDKFYQSSATKTGSGGTGLGLPICKEIIEGHNGRIWAENDIDGSANFIFIIPIDPHLDSSVVSA